MICPHCNKNSSKVVDSRASDEGHAIRRRRECENCGFRFTTFEKIEESPLLVVKKTGNREEFSRDKVLRGIVRAAEKRPISIDTMREIVSQVEGELRATGESEIASDLIGEHVMRKLFDIDDVTYIRFASVYRDFKDMNVFMQEVKELMSNNLGNKANN